MNRFFKFINERRPISFSYNLPDKIFYSKELKCYFLLEKVFNFGYNALDGQAQDYLYTRLFRYF
jgi:hypothetical protein